MKVFIENEAGSNSKNLFNEKTMEYKKTYAVSRAYPYLYGFILDTTSGDGDNLDCFVITNRKLASQVVVEPEPIGVMELREDGQEDHKVIATFPDEGLQLTDDVKKELRDFALHVFDHMSGKTMLVGDFYDKETALELLKRSADH